MGKKGKRERQREREQEQPWPLGKRAHRRRFRAYFFHSGFFCECLRCLLHPAHTPLSDECMRMALELRQRHAPARYKAVVVALVCSPMAEAEAEAQAEALALRCFSNPRPRTARAYLRPCCMCDSLEQHMITMERTPTALMMVSRGCIETSRLRMQVRDT